MLVDRGDSAIRSIDGETQPWHGGFGQVWSLRGGLDGPAQRPSAEEAQDCSGQEPNGVHHASLLFYFPCGWQRCILLKS